MCSTDRIILGLAAIGVLIVAAPPERANTSSRTPAEIAFVSRYALSVVRADGTGRRRLLTSPAQLFDAAWSPDGETIAFTRRGAVYSVEVDGERPRFRFKGYEPSWSPDGSKLAFAWYVERNLEIFDDDLRDGCAWPQNPAAHTGARRGRLYRSGTGLVARWAVDRIQPLA